MRFEEIVNNICLDWRNYSTYAHNFYIQLFWLFIIFGVLQKFIYNKTFHTTIWEMKSENTIKYKILKFLKLNTLEFKFNLFQDLQELTVGVLMVRIFQIYYISKIYLGGL
jgi:hypothetical protein